MYKLPGNLKEIRAKKKLTQTQIAEKLGMTYQEYQKIEAGKTVIRADKLIHICETLGVSADELLGLKKQGIELIATDFKGIHEAAALKDVKPVFEKGRAATVKRALKVKIEE